MKRGILRERVLVTMVVGAIGLGLGVVKAVPAEAELIRMAIDERRSFADGQPFGSTGPYESVRGRFHFEIDPDDPANARITDLELAPRNERGRVEFSSDFLMLKPIDPSRGNRRLLYDVTNRGNLLALWTFNEGERTNDPSTAAHAGNGFLLRRGYTLLWSGWNGDVQADGTDRMLIDLPTAEKEGEPVRGKVHLEISVDEPERSRTFGWSPWGVAAAYPVVDPDDPDARLTKRLHRGKPGVKVSRDRWRFGRWEPERGGDGRVVPDPRSLYIEGGLQPGRLYDITYTAEAPRVAGLGPAGIRDAVSFLRYEKEDASGSPNPLNGALDHAYLFGISQSGRLVNYFVYEGFNHDPENRIVFDGAIAHVAGAGRGLFNHRFGLATRYSTQHRDNLAGSEMFPFATVPQQDPATDETGDILSRARAAEATPKMFFVQTSTEYWSRGASLLHTDVKGRQDLEIDPSVRLYLIAGSSHLGAQEPTPGIGQTPRNPLVHRGPVLRALLVAMDRWVGEGKEPPESRYPRIDEGTLVPIDEFREAFPDIPGVAVPEVHYEPFRLDFGPRWEEGIADTVPPEVGRPYETLVPMVDEDGNELAGIRLPQIVAPLGTYTGWSLRAAEYGAEGMLAGLDGSYLAFPKTSEERRATGDPRAALLERYPTRRDYLTALTEAAMELEAEGYLLAEDALEMIRAAKGKDLWSEP